MNPERMFKWERDKRVKSLMDRGYTKLTEIKMRKVMPDEPRMHAKDPVKLDST